DNLRAPAGGVVGVNLNNLIFGYFGTVGATIIFMTLFAVSALFLTNFQLGEWLRRIWGRKKEESEEEEVLERRARDLKKQTRALEQEVERSGLGADGKPVPEPMVRDLSVPQAKA